MEWPRARCAWLLPGLLIAPFLVIMFLGAMLPAIDFDVLEYHLQGPKEYYQAGRIAFLPHNVYTSMPFGVEMLHLLGMEVLGDWWWGGLVGQLLVALYAPAAAVLIAAAAGRRQPRAGWLAAVIYLSTPWIYRLAVIAYVEGPLCFYHAALVWAVSSRLERSRNLPRVALGPAGSAGRWGDGLQVPGLDLGGDPVWLSRRCSTRDEAARCVLFWLMPWAGRLVMAPWLGKNVIDTGNPVYPLGYHVFGGRNWDEAREAQWFRVHGPFRPALQDVLGILWSTLPDGPTGNRPCTWRSPRLPSAGAVRGERRWRGGWVCGLPVPHLVVPDPSPGPVLAAVASRPWRSWRVWGPTGPSGCRGACSAGPFWRLRFSVTSLIAPRP